MNTIQATLQSKEQITETIFQYIFNLKEDIDFVPGQFANVLVAPQTWRAYSIVELQNSQLTLLVDISPGGPGSQFFMHITAGSQTEMLLPLGRFVLQNTMNFKIFIATGTGVAPFIPMIRSLQPDKQYQLLFGVRNLSTFWLDRFLPPVNTVYCVTGKVDDSLRNSTHEIFQGRVTKFIREQSTHFDRSTDFYICGSKAMVLDTRNILKQEGFQNIYFEPY